MSLKGKEKENEGEISPRNRDVIEWPALKSNNWSTSSVQKSSDSN